MPERIQLSRRKGWRMPANTVKVDRSTKWGNPFIVGKHGTREDCVKLFRFLLSGCLCITVDAECADAQRAYIALHGAPTHLNPKALLPYAVTAAKARGYTTEQIQLARAHASITTTEGYIQHHGVPVSELMLELPPKPAGVLDKP